MSDSTLQGSCLCGAVAYQIDGRTICAFGEACSWPTQSFLNKFPEEFKKHTKRGNTGKPLNAEAEIAAASIQS